MEGRAQSMKSLYGSISRVGRYARQAVVEKRGSATDAITESTAISGTTEIVTVYSDAADSIGGSTARSTQSAVSGETDETTGFSIGY